MLGKVILIYVLILGESFRVLDVNLAIWLIAIDLIVGLFRKSTVGRLFPIAILSFLTWLSVERYPVYHIAQDAFIVLVFLWAFTNQWDFSFVKSLLKMALWTILMKTLIIYFFVVDLSWGSGDFLDGNLFDFGFYKRIQIKGADAFLMIYPFFCSIRRLTPSALVFYVLVIFSGSRALMAYSLMLLVIQSNLSTVQLLKATFIVSTLLLVLFKFLNFQSRFKEDDGRGQSWRLLETAIVLGEIDGKWLTGNGLGAGFDMPVASGSTLEGGVNLYTHNILSWLLLKGGLVFVFGFFWILYGIFHLSNTRTVILIILLIVLNLVNNYIVTFSGILLFTIYLKFVGHEREYQRDNSRYAVEEG